MPTPKTPAPTPAPGPARAAPAAPEASPEATRAQRASAIFDRLRAGDFEGARADFDPTMREKLPAAALEGVWKQIGGQVGALASCELRIERPARDLVVRSYDCAFERGHLGSRVVFDGEQRVAGLFFAPLASMTELSKAEEPEDPRFVSRSIAVGPTGDDLPGTLTLPRSAARAPGVVLVHGSGPNDRDETIGASKPFRDLAVGLAARGIAVLRYDKRTLARPAELATKRDLTVKEEVLDDARAAVDVLRGQPEVDPARVYVVGHSLGATVAPRIAAGDRGVAGIVMLAAAARPLGVVAIEQADYLAKNQALSADEKAKLDALRAEAKRMLDPTLSPSTPGLLLGAPASYWIDLRGYDPVATARSLDVPILLVHGGRDYQVTERELDLWRRGLAGRPEVHIDEVPAIDHRLVAGQGPSTLADYATPGHVDEAVIDAIARFVKGPAKP